MSLTKTLTIACGVCATFSPAFAFDVTGGEVSVGHSFFTDDSDFARSGIEGSVELGFSQTLGVQVDASLQRFNVAGETATAFAVHGLYHISEATSAGIFVGTENVASENNTYYGAEIGTELARSDFEGYIGSGEEEGIGATVLGLSGTYNINDTFSLGASLDYVNLEGDASLTRFGVTGDYAIGEQTNIYAEIGTLSASDAGNSGSETFVGIGAEFNFGAERGATFERRGLVGLLPGL
jgi:hypothetical protein